MVLNIFTNWIFYYDRLCYEHGSDLVQVDDSDADEHIVRFLEGQVELKMAKYGPSMAPRRPRMAPNWLQVGEHEVKMDKIKLQRPKSKKA